MGGGLLGCKGNETAQDPGLDTLITVPEAWLTSSTDSFASVPNDTIEMGIDSFRQQGYVTYKLWPQLHDIRIYNPTETGGAHTFRSVANVALEEGKVLSFAMNGGMYRSDQSAQGLLVIEGSNLRPLDTLTLGYGNFYLQPNGVFALDSSGNAYVLPTASYAALTDTVGIRFATQSGPMLLVEGMINPVFTDGSVNKHIRNAVGTTPGGQVVFAISTRPISFFDLASVMRLKGCTQALYLDGFVSRIYVPAMAIGQLTDGNGLGPLITIFDDLAPAVVY